MQKVCMLVFLACAASAAAQETESGTDTEERNFIEVFVGITHDDGENSFLTRVGGSYEFEFSGWSLSPEVNIDFVDQGTVVVIGASFVWKF